jgi:hypothetical protein
MSNFLKKLSFFMIYTNYFYFIKINIYLVQEILLVEGGGEMNV